MNPIREMKKHMVAELGILPTRDSVERTVLNTYKTFDTLIEQWQQQPETKISCKSGCIACCAQSVWAAEPEVLYIAAELRRHGLKEESVPRLREHREAVACITPQQAPRLCLFVLPSDSCMVYDMRPIACRMLYSNDARACEANVRGLSPFVSFLPDPASWATELRMSLFAAIAESGLRCQTLDFHHALEIALSDDTAEERWVKGENAFEAAVVPGQPDLAAAALAAAAAD